MQPLFRWVGGKRWLAARLVGEIIATKPKCYAEPFLGAGAVTLALPASLPKQCGDDNAALINVWRQVRTDPQGLARELGIMARACPNTPEGYATARTLLNTALANSALGTTYAAAITLLVLTYCFNGLWRTNQGGLFNVPFGRRTSPTLPTEAVLFACRAHVQSADFVVGDFREFFTRVANDAMGLAVYADPPYAGTFDGYTANAFDDEDQRDLAAWLHFLAARGAKIWTTNSDTPRIRELYAWARVEEVSEQHNVGATGARRGKRSCLLIRG